MDKGNGIVILNSKDYFDKLDDIIHDSTKFEKVPAPSTMSDPIIRNEKKIRDYLRNNVKDKISKEEYDKLNPSGSQPGKLYGLCKAHKTGMPLRPVVSMIGTAEYKLSKFLDDMIKPHIPSRSMLTSTSNFLERLKTFVFHPKDILVSFDVVSLFTNVPLAETIDIIADHIYQKPETKPPFEKSIFKELVKKATGGIFLYQGEYFRQIDGVTMGSPLGPTMANFCLAHYENELLSKAQDKYKPALYLRYVDDIFCVFREGQQHEPLLQQLNNMHRNLRFTVEIGGKSLAFLDTVITLPNNESEMFNSKVYRKPTFTGLILNSTAMCPAKWKFGLIKCLLHRAYVISSDWFTMHKEIEFLRTLFMENGYSDGLFSSCLQRFLSEKFSTSAAKTKVREDGVETIFSIPYVGLPSTIYARKIQQLMKDNFGITVRVIFNTFKVKNYFSLKCTTPTPLLANVVYKFQCLRDSNKAYIGKTKRHLTTRVKEHYQGPSAIQNHLDSCNACKEQFSCQSFVVIDSGQTDFDITIKEALHIKHHRPWLNKQLHSQGSSFVLNIF